MEPSCNNCVYGVFCPTWGNYKCMERRIRVDSGTLKEPCKSYKMGSPEVEKCQCEDCLENYFEE